MPNWQTPTRILLLITRKTGVGKTPLPRLNTILVQVPVELDVLALKGCR